MSVRDGNVTPDYAAGIPAAGTRVNTPRGPGVVTGAWTDRRRNVEHALVQLDNGRGETAVEAPLLVEITERRDEEMSTDAAPASAMVPAVRQPDPVMERIARVGQWLALAETGSQDERSRGAAAALRLYFADTLGLPPLAANEISVIKGKLYVQTKLLRALAAKRGYTVEKVESTEERCTAAVMKDGRELGRYTFTMEDAKRAGLVRAASAWTSHPARMLWARAAKFALDDAAPHVTLGLGTADDEGYEVQDRPVPPPTGDVDASDVPFDYDAPPDAVVEEPPAPAPEEPEPEPEPEPADPAPEGDPVPSGGITTAQNARLHQLYQQRGLSDRDARMNYTRQVLARPDLTSSRELTKKEASVLIDLLADDSTDWPTE